MTSIATVVVNCAPEWAKLMKVGVCTLVPLVVSCRLQVHSAISSTSSESPPMLLQYKVQGSGSVQLLLLCTQASSHTPARQDRLCPMMRLLSSLLMYNLD